MKVLVADDQPMSRLILGSALRRWGYDVVLASDGLEVAAILQRPDFPKLLLLDWLMPGMDGLQLCREIRRTQGEGPYTYVLLLTSRSDKHDIVAGLESGADDYLTKPFDPSELKMRLRTGCRILELMDQLVAARESLREAATHDSLTGIWNRGAILDSLEAERLRAQRQGSPLGVVLFDLDHFKTINDTYGHPVGDEVLREVARAVRTSIRPYDLVGRYGGEEFLVLLPGCDEVTTASHAERMRTALQQLAIPGHDRLHITASFGTAVLERDSLAVASELVQAADESLYRAKRAGRNRVEFTGAEAAEEILAT